MAIKKPEPVFQVHDQELQGDDALRRFFEACHDPGQAEPSLAYSEATFDGVPFFHVQSFDPLFLHVNEGWTTERRTAQPDAVLPTESEVPPGTIDLVCQDSLRIATVTFLVVFHRLYQIAALVEGIKAQVIDEGVSVHHTDRNFGPELGLRPGLTSHDRTHMGLRDTDDTVIDLVCPGLVHLFLLIKESANGSQFFRLPVAQIAVAVKY